eukprot:1041507-Amphidinium_carterae.1
MSLLWDPSSVALVWSLDVRLRCECFLKTCLDTCSKGKKRTPAAALDALPAFRAIERQRNISNMDTKAQTSFSQPPESELEGIHNEISFRFCTSELWES